METPKATLEDLYQQNESIISHLEKLNENLQLIREAAYGQTVKESGLNFDKPKHGAFGAVGESSAQLELVLGEILAAVSKRK